MFPRLLINLDEVEQNARKVLDLSKKNGVELVGVTKVTLGDPLIAEAMKRAGVEIIGESRVKNVERMLKAGIKGPFMLLRVPMPSEFRKVVELFDYVLVSDPKVVNGLQELADELGKELKMIYMVDVGDLREGVWFERAVEEISQCKRCNVVGIGTNFGCYAGVIPSSKHMEILLDIKEQLERNHSMRIEYVSAGNTSAILMMERGELPQGINQYRVGEAIVLGTDVTNGRVIEWLSQDTFVLEAEVIEVKEKPSVPFGERGFDAFGRRVEFEDRGIRVRAICAVGEQDVDYRGLKPVEEGVEVLHASSDHLVLDVTDAKRNVSLGDTIRFRMNYSCLLRAMTSPFVEKVYSRA